MIAPDEAYSKIMEIVKEYGKKEKRLLEEACGKTITEEIVAQENIPPFARSAFDGYAFVAAETKSASGNNPVGFEIAATVPAGGKLKRVDRGEKTIKIMTGAPLPPGYDCVVPWENVSVKGNKVFIFKPLYPGENVVPEGKDIKKGDLIFSKGEILEPADIGVLAALGYREVEVIALPRVGIIVSGDELVELGEKPGEGKIRNSNRYILTAFLAELGINVKYFGIARDCRDELKRKLKKALLEADLLITTGGVSEGEYDLMPAALSEIGARRVFWGIKGKPGASIHVSEHKKTPVFSLSGNPTALFASYKIFVEKAILKMLGFVEGRDMYEGTIKASLACDLVNKTTDQWRFVRAKLGHERGRLWCIELNKEKTGDICSSSSLGFIILAPGDKDLKRGALVDFMPLNGRCFLNDRNNRREE